MKKFLTLLSALAVTTVSTTSITHAEEKFSEEQTKQIELLIQDYIKNNPKVIMESLEDYRVQELERVEKEAKEKAANLSKELKENNDYPFAGNKDGDIVVAEFFDYNCGYCKKALDGVQKIVKNDENVKVVFIELPILGQSSSLAAQWALAAGEQGKYFEFHQALMEHRGQKSEEELEKLATSLELNVEKLKEDAKGSKISKALTENRELANSLGVSGTPAFIIENEVIRGYIPYEAMQETIDGLRAEKKN